MRADGAAGGRPAGSEFVVVVSPIIGTGTDADPKRPLLIPAEGLPPGVLSYSWEASDDGKFAIVEFRALNRDALDFLDASGRSDVKVFKPHKHAKDDVEKELKKLKKDFDMNRFHGRRP